MDIANMSSDVFIILFIVSIIAGFLDTLAGGGGLISLPALIVSGVPPLAALGTNKLQGSVGTATASIMMFKNKRVNWESIKYLMLSAFIGAMVGTIAVQFVDTEVLSFVIPIVLICISVYFLFSPKPHVGGNPKVSKQQHRNLVIPSIGFYDGMFGPGTGSFFALSGVSCRGYDLIKSTAIAKPLNFSTNIASLIVFLLAGQVVWLVGGLMMLGQVIGAWLGAHCLFNINPKLLRGIVVTMCMGMLIKYSYTMGWMSFLSF